MELRVCIEAESLNKNASLFKQFTSKQMLTTVKYV